MDTTVEGYTIKPLHTVAVIGAVQHHCQRDEQEQAGHVRPVAGRETGQQQEEGQQRAGNGAGERVAGSRGSLGGLGRREKAGLSRGAAVTLLQSSLEVN